MTDTVICYFKNAEGEVHPVRLPSIEAVTACRRHPDAWSRTAAGHTSVPEGELDAGSWVLGGIDYER